jgi:transforming growth factor-beta-induced protein
MYKKYVQYMYIYWTARFKKENTMRKPIALLVSIVLLLTLVAPVMAQESRKTIVDVAVEDGRFMTLVAAVQAAGLAETLSGEGPFTVFAPTDDAFAALPAGTVEALLNDTPALTEILLDHVVAGKAMAADVVGLESVTTLQGFDISISVTDEGVFLNDTVKVIITDIEASNGVIHVIDAVLLPPLGVTNNSPNNLNFRDGPGLDQDIIGTFPVGAKAQALARNAGADWVQIQYNGQIGWVFASLTTPSGDLLSLEVAPGNIVEIAVADGRFTTLVAAVQAAGLVEALSDQGPLTVFAPTDDAFAALPAGTVEALLNDIPALTDILLYHVVAGKAMAADVVGLEKVTTLQGSDVTITVNDQGVFLNDTVKVIITDMEASNGVIHVIDAVLLPPAKEAMPAATGTIVDLAVADGRFTTLVAAVQAAGLAETLSGEGPFTVFAPTDDAFAALPAGTVEALLNDIPTLTNILLYHVVAGKTMAADVVNLDKVTTLQGADITITVTDEGVLLNGTVKVIITDIEASNGVIHVIDAVLLPPAM